MNPYLLYPNRDFNIGQPLVWNSDELMKDLELQVLLDTMSDGNNVIDTVVPKVLLQEDINDIPTILYRQNILKDCLANSAIIKSLFDLSLKAIESKKTSWYGIFIKHPTSLLHSSVALMEISMDFLRQFREIAAQVISQFQSDGMLRFFRIFIEQTDDAYFIQVMENLKSLKLYGRIHTSVELGRANKGTQYTLRKNTQKKHTWWNWLFPSKIEGYYFGINPRDIGGCNALSSLNDQMVNRTANTLAQANDHLTDFFTLIRDELAFYLGCINLHDRLKNLKMPVGFPEPVPTHQESFNVTGLYDPCLALTAGHQLVGNDISGDKKLLFIITGVNRGGKSTFLRSVGIAQLMMQSGIFVAATKFKSNPAGHIATHFKKEEDRSMNSGKFDEELHRMNEIVRHLKKGDFVLFNESFAATNEKEGSDVATQIVSALQLSNIKVFFVTHLYDFAFSYYQNKTDSILFLQASREKDTQIGKLTEGFPLPTSFAEDLYNKIFE